MPEVRSTGRGAVMLPSRPCLAGRVSVLGRKGGQSLFLFRRGELACPGEGSQAVSIGGSGTWRLDVEKEKEPKSGRAAMATGLLTGKGY